MNQRIPKEWETEFFAGQRTEQVPFALNDYVKVMSGPLAGCYGSVISIMPGRPELSFLVEMNEGNDEVLAASVLQLESTDN